MVPASSSLVNDYNKEKQHYFLHKIRTIIKDQLVLLSDLLYTTAIEEGKLYMDFASDDLIDLINNRIEYFQSIAHNKQLEILSEMNSLPAFFFDRNRLKQVIDNLISNAIKYSPLGSKIIIRVAMIDHNTVEVSITDEGKGIPLEQQKKLFNRFQTVGSKTTAGEASVGLGLSICKSIIDMHNGTIGVDTTRTQGSRFYFRLNISESLQQTG